MESSFENTEVKLELLTDTEEEIRGEICQATDQYAKANDSYMKKYDKNKEIIISWILGYQ